MAPGQGYIANRDFICCLAVKDSASALYQGGWIMDLKAACDALRAHENNEVAAIVVQDAALQRILAVWPMVRRKEMVLQCDKANLDWLWLAVEFSEREAAELSGLPSGPGIAAFRRAKALGLIYPDGTIHRIASGVLRKTIRDALGAGGKGK